MDDLSVEKALKNVDTHVQERHGPRFFEEPRWRARNRPSPSSRPLSLHEVRGIAAKRQYEKFLRTVCLSQVMTGTQFVDGATSGELCRVVDWIDIGAALKWEIKRELFSEHRRLLVAFTAAMKLGWVAVWVTWDQIGEVLRKHASTARRRMGELVDNGLIRLESPMFEKLNRVSSQRGNAWSVAPFMLEGAALRTRTAVGGLSPLRSRKEQPSGTEVRTNFLGPARIEPLGSASASGGLDRELSHGCSRSAGEVEPEYFSAAVQGDAADAAGRSTRQAASTSSTPEAPDWASRDEKIAWLLGVNGGAA